MTQPETHQTTTPDYTPPQNTYTHGHHESVLRSHRSRTVENSAAYLVPHLAAGQSVLDVGCGPGTITVGLAELVAPGVVTAVELTADVLKLAQDEVAARGTANVRFAVTDVHALDFPDDTFDVVHTHQVLQHVADPVRALEEMRRVCKPGGLVAVRDGDYGGFRWFPEEPVLDTWLAAYQSLAFSNGGHPDAGRRLRSWALAAGFPAENLKATASSWVFADDAERAWWAELWADRTTKSSTAEQYVAKGIATEAELQTIGEAWHAWSRHPDAVFIVSHGELVCVA